MARKHPTKEMVNDLAEVFQKHNWSGQPIGLASAPLDSDTTAANDSDDNLCPDGSEPRWVTYKLPNGTWATKKMCL
jgi:hypothetical protein